MECVILAQRNSFKNQVEDTTQYEYVVECVDKQVHLLVEARDVFHNADNEIDCPLDVVLRKNKYSFQDLMNWDAREVKFIQIVDGEETILNSVSLNVNL